MPAVLGSRRTMSAPLGANHIRARSSPYPSRASLNTVSSRKVRRGSDGLRARGRQVLAEIDWWTIMAGQLPGSGSESSAEPSESDTSSMYTQEETITSEDETERLGFVMDVSEICLGTPPSSPASSGCAALWSVSSGRSSPLSVGTVNLQSPVLSCPLSSPSSSECGINKGTIFAT
ncbi:uncharacterized protein EI90DRAFT_3121539 [Cantharellus anzutake]|uniref:uncharacterized protein n=1 Tax=Cantharellus anzutake TaxID=1750568 RepID=UPI00190414DF|nr:uncharacterized protein EI90DRAFT_3121539 [Cantharellus anzutake]KAF8334207.1 hypothetical protein EI90DRAFT_3121539 [Cantharellus anzutake]